VAFSQEQPTVTGTIASFVVLNTCNANINDSVGSGPLILLAEDSDDDAFFFERALAKCTIPCGIIRARNGKIAIEKLQKAFNGAPHERVPDLIFLDLKMPVMSGFEVLEWLKQNNPNPPFKVIVLSGSNDHEDRDRAKALGGVDYIVKPIGSKELARRIHALTAQNSSDSEKKGEQV